MPTGGQIDTEDDPKVEAKLSRTIAPGNYQLGVQAVG